MCVIVLERERRKVLFRLREIEKKIDFVMIKKEHWRFIQHVNAIPEGLEHRLVVADKNMIKKLLRKTHIE